MRVLECMYELAKAACACMRECVYMCMHFAASDFMCVTVRVPVCVSTIVFIFCYRLFYYFTYYYYNY